MIQIVKPMLAENANPHSRPDWGYELKLDGQRCIGHFTKGQTELQARSGRLVTTCYPEIILQAKHDVIVDGEMICELPSGLPDFPMIERRMKQSKTILINHLVKTHPAKLWVFDIVAINGESVRNRPLVERKALLSAELIPNDRVRVLPWTIGNGIHLFEKAVTAGYEGVMAKALNSQYIEDRSPCWQKMKPLKMGWFYAVGLTVSDNREFRSIILARNMPGGLQYVSTVASGLSDADVQTWFAKPAITPHSGASVAVPVDVKVLRWIEPELVRVWFYEYTEGGHLRFPRLTPGNIQY